MADITKNSFDATLRHQKVVFQRGRPVQDYELNEAQDIARVGGFRAVDAVAAASHYPWAPGATDVFVEATGGNNEVLVKAGTIVCDGIPVVFDADQTFTGFTTYMGVGTRKDTVYVRLMELEVADPLPSAKIGETTKRKQLSVTIGVLEGGTAADVIALNSSAEIWESGVGIRYFPLGTADRPTGDPAINDVFDTRRGPFSGMRLGAVITCGDGQSSVGDFTGRDAIHQAITAADLAGWPSTIIYVKKGTYTCDSTSGAITLAGMASYTIIGAGRGVTSIEADATAPAVFFNVDAGVHLHLQDIGLVGINAASVVMARECSFHLQDAYINDATLKLGDNVYSDIPTQHGRPVHLSRSYFSNDSATAIEVQTLVDSEAIDFDDCMIEGQTASLRLVHLKADATLATVVTFGGLRFRRCKFITVGTTVSGGNLAVNTGPVDVDPNTTIEKLTVTEILFDDCTVQSTIDVGTVGVLLNVKPHANGFAYTAAGTDPVVTIVKLTIRGGSWLVVSATSGSSLLSPFVAIAGAIDIRDVATGVVTGSALPVAASPTDCAYYFGNATFGASGFYGLASPSMIVRDLTIYGMCRKQTLGDVGINLLGSGAVVDIDNLVVRDYTGDGSGTQPAHRVRIGGGNTYPQWCGKIRGIRLLGRDFIAVGEDWTTSITKPYVQIDAVASPSKAVIEECEVSGFQQNGAASARVAFYCPLLDAYKTNGMVFRELTASYVQDGLFLDFLSATGGEAGVMEIDGCRFSNNIAFGIQAMLTVDWNALILTKNTCESNGDVGIQIYSSSWNDYMTGAILMGNFCMNNDPTDKVQIRIYNDNAANEPNGTAFGNVLMYGGFPGYFRINKTNVPTALTDEATPVTTWFRGVETGVSLIDGKKRRFVSTDSMHHNVGTLLTP